MDDLKREARAYEVGKQAVKAMEPRDNSTVARVNVKPVSTSNRSKPRSKRQVPSQCIGKCHRCGSSSHLKPQCTKNDSNCYCTFCKTKGHVHSVCFSRFSSSSQASRIHSQAAAPDQDDDLISLVTCRNPVSLTAQVNSVSQPTPKLLLNLSPTCDSSLSFKFNVTPDTGATRSVIARKQQPHHQSHRQSGSLR